MSTRNRRPTRAARDALVEDLLLPGKLYLRQARQVESIACSVAILVNAPTTWPAVRVG